jgi:alkaline phosphatase
MHEAVGKPSRLCADLHNRQVCPFSVNELELQWPVSNAQLGRELQTVKRFRIIAGVTAFLFILLTNASSVLLAQQEPPKDYLREMQFRAVSDKEADWIHWGDDSSKFSNWTNHSNRLIPVYTYGVSLKSIKNENSIYRDAARLEKLYDRPADDSVNEKARYFDQTQIYDLQKSALASGKKNIILFICDGMDWQTTQAAAIYKNKKVEYKKGRGKGLSFLDYRKGNSEYGAMVTSPYTGSTKYDVDSQTVTEQGSPTGGYNATLGGANPWTRAPSEGYLLGKSAQNGHTVNDSAASATAMTTGKKTYKSSINVSPDGKQYKTIAHEMQEEGYAIGLVTSVPISHATPACAYAHNVNRNDYQDISRDLLGLKSVSHKRKPLDGVDVLIGCGVTNDTDDDREKQGENYIPGNKYVAAEMLQSIDVTSGGKYVVAQRTKDKDGSKVLMDAAKQAVDEKARLFGFFGFSAHLPYRTADGSYDPTIGDDSGERYKPEDLKENPELAEMATAALMVLGENEKGFWLMVESGDIDWANHNNNIDDAIGGVFDAEATFDAVVDWVETNSSWDETALIFTADHGHMLVIEDSEALTGNRMLGPWVSPRLAEVESFPRLVTNVEVAMEDADDDQVEIMLGNELMTELKTEKFSVIVEEDGEEKQVTRSRQGPANKVNKFIEVTDGLVFRKLDGESMDARKAIEMIKEMKSFLWLPKYSQPTKAQVELFNSNLILVSRVENADSDEAED